MVERVLVIIPARAGSKGVKHKNIRDLGGRPLVEWTFAFANAVRDRYVRHDDLVDIRPIVSSDISGIEALSGRYGIEFNGTRPSHLCGDSVQTIDVVQYELAKFVETHGVVDFIALLQPTCPFRLVSSFVEALDILRDASEAFNSVVSISDVGGQHPLRMKVVQSGCLINYMDGGSEDNMVPRQALPQVFIRSGSLYMSKSEIIAGGRLTAAPCSFVEDTYPYNVNIDGLVDFDLAAIHAQQMSSNEDFLWV